MTWTDLVDAVATRTGIPRSQVKAVLKGLAEEVRVAEVQGVELADGDAEAAHGAAATACCSR